MQDQIRAALAEVDSFLRRKGTDYERFLEDVLRELARYTERRKNSSVIYRVYSRADKQARGEKLKSRLGIATKLVAWRETNPGCKINEIHDIIGVTIVVFFEKEIELVCHGLKGLQSELFEVISDEPISRSDYNARHVIVARRVSAAKQNLAFRVLCEIQIKSLLHDGWAARTHDLFYKSKGGKDPRIAGQVQALTKLVKSLEEQSDILRSYILKDDEDDEVRRDAAVSQLFYQTTQSPSTEVEKVIADISAALLKDRDYFSKCPESDPLLAGLLGRWKAVASSSEHRPNCRFMVLLALVRTARDFDAEALETIDNWIACASSDLDRAGALSFKALAVWALGDLNEAIEAARAAVSFAEEKGMAAVDRLRANLAYYVAENLFLTKNAAAAAAAPEIVEFLKMSFPQTGERHNMSILDTRGAVLIMTATHADQVWEGQRLCHQARKWAQDQGEDKPVFELFYELHERRARRRLRELA